MSKNKVTFGLKKVHVAFLKFNGTVPTWEEPIHIPGAVSFSPEPQGEQSNFAADDEAAYWSHNTNNGYAGDLSMALIPDAILARMLGWRIDSNGMVVEETGGEQEEFALLFEVQGDKRGRRNVYYRCKAARPSKEYTTKGETVEPNPDNISLTILPLEVDGKTIVKGSIELSDTNAAVYNSFYNAVLLPDDEPATADKTKLAAAIALGDSLDEADYTVDSWAAFSAALAAAIIINDGVDATQSEINAAREALTEAIFGLVPVEG